MGNKPPKRISDIIDALPLRPGIRVLEIGCGTGVAAREIVNRFDTIYVLGIDRSEKAIYQAIKGSQKEIDEGSLGFVCADVESFLLSENEKQFDIAFAIRVGALDGRHPEIEQEAKQMIYKALKKGARLFIDGGNPLREIPLP